MVHIKYILSYYLRVKLSCGFLFQIWTSNTSWGDRRQWRGLVINASYIGFSLFRAEVLTEVMMVTSQYKQKYEMDLKISSAKWRPFLFGNVLGLTCTHTHIIGNNIFSNLKCMIKCLHTNHCIKVQQECKLLSGFTLSHGGVKTRRYIYNKIPSSL